MPINNNFEEYKFVEIPFDTNVRDCTYCYRKPVKYTLCGIVEKIECSNCNNCIVATILDINHHRDKRLVESLWDTLQLDIADTLDRVREDGYNDGMEDGYNESRDEIRDEAYNEGYATGYTEGERDGHENGYTEGRNSQGDDR